MLTRTEFIDERSITFLKNVQTSTDKGVILLISGRKIPEKLKGDRGLKKEENSMYIYAKKKSFLFFENLKSLDFSVHVIPN